MSPRTGRRSGDVDTREEILGDTRDDILVAARSLFAARGYDATSLRAIARAAEVDPALVHHYFDGKADVFTSAFALPFPPEVMVPRVVDGPRDEIGERLVRLFLDVWNGPGAEHLVGILRSALTHEAAAAMLREFMTATLLEGIASSLDVDEPRTRAALCAAHVVGLGVLRPIIGFRALREVDDEELVAGVAPTLQRYLTGPLPG